MVSPASLKRIEVEGYYPHTVHQHALEKLDVVSVQTEHDTMESAVEEIKKNADKLKFLDLTILPVISINYEGEIS